MNHRLTRFAIGAIAIAASTVTAAPTATPPTPGATSIYRFDVAITGLDATAKPSTYTLVLEENSHGGLSTGANIPTMNASGNARQDVGLKMGFRYSLRGSVVVLEGSVEVSSLDPATSAGGATVHRVQAESAVPITAGTPALFSSLVDITSHRRYEVTVTAQRLL